MRATVNGKALKSVFIDIAGILKKYDRAKVVGIETAKTAITFTVDTGSCYVRTLEISSVSDAVNMTLTVMFSDLAYFIPTKEDVTIDITECYVELITSKSDMLLQVGDSIVAPYQPRKGKIVDLDYGILRKAVKLFTSTQDLQKAYGRDFAVSFYGEWALMRSPTVWIHTKAQGLRCALSLEQMRSIVSFQPTFVEESDRLEFHKEGALLSVPKILPTEADSFEHHTKDMKLASVLLMHGVIKDLLEMKRALGDVQAEISLHEVGFNLRLNKGGITLSRDYNKTGDSVFRFRYMFNIFIMALNLLGENTQIEIWIKEGMICLRSTETSILLSV